MQEQVATESDLKALNRFTLKELAGDDVFIFSALFIGKDPTANNRIWSQEWMEAAIDRKLFDGIPFLTNHENDQAMKIGTVFSAELRDDGIHGKVFIPLDEQGKQSKEAVENGRIRSVSINADGESKREGDLTKILPSDTMRVFEVSAVAVPGCKTCVVTEDTKGGACESTESATCNHDSILLDFARGELNSLQAEFVRLTGFAFGASIDRAVYQKVAEKLDPTTLKTICHDLRESAHNNANKAIEVDGDIEQVKKSLQQINAVKGV